jgi:hypothetical protein
MDGILHMHPLLLSFTLKQEAPAFTVVWTSLVCTPMINSRPSLFWLAGPVDTNELGVIDRFQY